MLYNNSYATDVGPATYGSDHTWDLAGSPWIVQGDVMVVNCATLTIEAGVEVKFDAGTGLRLGNGPNTGKDYGILRAEGTEEYPITFTTNSPGQYWKGIDFRWKPVDGGRGGNNILSYCTIVEFQLKSPVSTKTIPQSVPR